MQHGWICNLAHHLAAGAVILSNAQSLAQYVLILSAQTRGHCGNAQRIPRTGRVIITDGVVQRQSRAASHLIPNDEGSQRLRPGQIRKFLRQHRQCWRGDNAYMPFDRIVPIMAIKIVSLRGGGKSSARQTGHPPVKQHACAVIRISAPIQPHGSLAGQNTRLHRRGRDADAQRVQQQQSRPFHDRGRNVLGPQAQCEPRDLGESSALAIYDVGHFVHAKITSPLPQR